MLNWHPAYMLNSHPLVVHYPLALLTAAFVCELLWLIFRKEALHHATTVTLVLGTLSAILAVGTGLWAAATVPHPEPAHEVMETHETFALISFGLAAALSVWRLWLWKRLTRVRFLFSLGLLAMAVLISYAGHLGGRMVYQYGVGGTAVKMPAEEGGHHHEGEEAAGHHEGEAGHQSHPSGEHD